MAKISKKILEYTVLFEPQKEGGYVASVPALEGCMTQGETFEETIKNVRDAISGVLAVMKKEGIKIPEEKSETVSLKISVPYSFA